jgi:hypothetical protein
VASEEEPVKREEQEPLALSDDITVPSESQPIPLKGALYAAIEKHLPAGGIPIGKYGANAFSGAYDAAVRYVPVLEALAQQPPVPCHRCQRTEAWFVVDATTLPLTAWPGGDPMGYCFARLQPLL